MPSSEIETGLAAFDILFPTPNGCFVDHPTSNLRFLKVFPIPFFGNGADYRKKLYTNPPDFLSLQLTGVHTLDDLIRWNNACVDFLV